MVLSFATVKIKYSSIIWTFFIVWQGTAGGKIDLFVTYQHIPDDSGHVIHCWYIFEKTD